MTPTVKIIDNDRKKLLDILQDISLSHDMLSIATGYWDLPGTTLLIENIQNYARIRLLIGQEPMIPRHQVKLDLHGVEADFPSADIFSDLERLRPTPELRRTVEILRDMITSGRLEVRIYRRSFLHAKCYIFGDYGSDTAIGIIGSSNFTKNGLTQNAELNTLESDHRIVTFSPKTETQEYGHLSWFDTFWEQGEDWTGGFELLIRHSRVGDLTYSPYEMYLATLHHLYQDDITDHIELPPEALNALYPFQQRNARDLIHKLETVKVAMLADSVGLGKTITAGAVIRYFLEKKATRIYVIAPARLTRQWEQDLADKHGLVSGFKVLSLQNMDMIAHEKELDRYKQVDLFIIDEAHNLRNENSTRYAQILEWFAGNPESQVLLMTATPVNNHLTDFTAQIQLASKGRRLAFPVVYETSKKTDIIDFWEAVGRLSTEIKKAENAGEQPEWDRIRRIMRDGLRRFLVRSTRSGIEREFGGITGTDGITRHFPQTRVEKEGYSFSKERENTIFEMIGAKISTACEGYDPRNIDLAKILDTTQRTEHPLDTVICEDMDSISQKEVFINIFQIVLLLGFAPYRPRTYEHLLYGKTSAEISALQIKGKDRFLISSQQSIHNMLRVGFLKRFESSPYALRKSLENYQKRLLQFEAMLEKGQIMSFSDIENLNKLIGTDITELSEEIFGEMPEKYGTEENGIQFVPADPTLYNIPQLQKDLLRDKNLITLLVSLLEVVESGDDKLEAFVELIRDRKARFPESGEKTLVFSFYADTVEYLSRELPQHFDAEYMSGVAFLSGKNTKEIDLLTKRFSPKSKGYALKEHETEIHTMIATDVLSEGQNLQDCGFLVNYDLHWNPVRMIQRNGRINRLGSSHSGVAIVNMYPAHYLEAYLNLVKTLERKIERIKNSVGTDQSILGEEALPIEFTEDVDTSLYGDHATEVFARLSDDDQDFLSEDEYIREYRHWRKTAAPEEITLVESLPKGKWGYLPLLTRDNPKAPSVIGLVSVGLTGSRGSDSTAHIFTETFSDGRPQSLSTLQALSHLHTTPAENQRLPDGLIYDCPHIERLSISIAEAKATNKRLFDAKPTPSQNRAFEALSKVFPGREIDRLLMDIETVQEEKERDRLIRLVNTDLKEHSTIRPQVSEQVGKFIDKLSQRIQETHSVTHTTSIFYYGK